MKPWNRTCKQKLQSFTQLSLSKIAESFALSKNVDSKMKTAIFIFMCIFSNALAADTLLAEKISLTNKTLEFTASMNFDSSRNIYTWFGEIRPALDYIFFIEIMDEQYREIKFELIDKRLPVFPHEGDVERTKSYKYKPLKVRFFKNIMTKCIYFRIRYDTVKLSKHYGFLDSLELKSRMKQICRN